MIVIDYLEFRRKILHMVVGILIVLGVYFQLLTPFILFVILLAGVIVSFLSKKYKIPVIYWLLDMFERKHVHPGKGAITFFVGSILALKLFPEDVALASIMILALGDGICAIIGPLGRVKSILSEKKLLEGTLAGILLATWGACFFVTFPEAFIGSFVSMSLEATEIRLNNKILSDNILVPLTAGTTIMLWNRYLPDIIIFFQGMF